MLDWTGAEDLLFRISKEQVSKFLEGPDKNDLYGAGFYCDALYGFVHLVANTVQYHQNRLRDFERSARQADLELVRTYPQVYQIDPEVFRWDTGNWKYPAGLFPSASAEQRAFDVAWEEYQKPLSQIERDEEGEIVDENQEILKDVCSRVLIKLFNDGAFSTVPRLLGFTILGPDDPQEAGLEMKNHFDSLLDVQR